MIRPRTLKRIKVRTPGGRTVIHLKKRSKKPLSSISTRTKRENLKERVRR